MAERSSHHQPARDEAGRQYSTPHEHFHGRGPRLSVGGREVTGL
jgi:hypothetical protein